MNIQLIQSSIIRNAQVPITEADIPKDEYVLLHLQGEMPLHQGRKRLRKKKASAVLRRRWYAHMLAQPIHRGVGYAAVGRKLFLVEPLPISALPISEG